MKKKLLMIAGVAVLMLGAVSCSKEKTCRCAVQNSSRVRIIKIESGNCEDIKYFKYHTALDSLKVEVLLCTDHEFEIDDIFNK